MLKYVVGGGEESKYSLIVCIKNDRYKVLETKYIINEIFRLCFSLVRLDAFVFIFLEERESEAVKLV